MISLEKQTPLFTFWKVSSINGVIFRKYNPKNNQFKKTLHDYDNQSFYL